MKTVIVWLLISISDGSGNAGTRGVLTVVDKFPTQNDCEWVRKEIDNTNVETKCVQAKVVQTW